jgi:hypothetical protein
MPMNAKKTKPIISKKTKKIIEKIKISPQKKPFQLQSLKWMNRNISLPH